MKKINLIAIIFALYCLSASNQSVFAQGSLSVGLTHQYCFDGNANDTKGTLHGTVMPGATLTTDRFGAVNKAYQFDGIGGYIDLPNDIWVNGDFTISAWVLMTNPATDYWQKVFEFSKGGTYVANTVFFSPRKDPSLWSTCTGGFGTPNGEVYGCHRDATCSASGTGGCYNVGVAFPSSVWTFVTVVQNGSTNTIYRNGVVSSTTNIDPPCPILRDENYFGKTAYGNPYFKGKLDDIRIYNRALSASEVSELFTTTNCAPPANNTCSQFNVPFSIYIDNWDLLDIGDVSPSPTATILAPGWLTGSGPGWVHPGYPALNPLDGTPYVVVQDANGSSHYFNAINYQNLGTTSLGSDISFDFAVFEDAFALDPILGATPIHPKIYLTDGVHTIYFEAYATVDDVSDNFVRTFAPIALESGGVLPSNLYGAWHLEPGTSISDFNNVMLNNTEIYFSIDVLASNRPFEVVGIDNVCIVQKPCNSNFNFVLDARTYIGPTPMPKVTLGLHEIHTTSYYTYNWGDGTSTSLVFSSPYIFTAGESHIYPPTPNSYNVCVTENTQSGNCTNCMNFCIPTTTFTNPECKTDFDFRLLANTSNPSWNQVYITLRSFNPTSTYIYDWGDLSSPTTGSFASADHSYTTSGTYSICVTEVVSGYCEGAKTCMNFCISDLFDPQLNLMKTTSVELAKVQNSNNVVIYPNPASNNFEIGFDLLNNEQVRIDILDMTGKLLYNFNSDLLTKGSQKLKVDIKDFQAGLYIVRLKTTNGETVEKLSIVK